MIYYNTCAAPIKAPCSTDVDEELRTLLILAPGSRPESRMASFSMVLVVTLLMVALNGVPVMSAFKGLSPFVGNHLTIRNCQDIQEKFVFLKNKGGKNKNKALASGVYTIFPYKSNSNYAVEVYCDMETDGGGWTVIQRRDDLEPREDFYRSWMEYAVGFGNLTGEFWLGLDDMHALTDQALNEVRFDLADFENNTRWANYRFFYVHDRDLSYKMEVNGYSGDAGSSFSYHNGSAFSAKDRDNDSNGGNCAQKYKGGWWYRSCHSSNLNGLYHGGIHSSYADGVNWSGWLGQRYSLKRTEIKIRPAY